MSPRKRNLVTGAVVLTALGVLTWMILTFSGRAVGLLKPKGMPVVFIADRADGLADGSPVLYRGVQVGKVTAVTFADDTQHVRIDGVIDHHPLPKNLIGQIKAQSQLGTSTLIDLRLAPNSDPGGELSANQQIPIKYLGNSVFPPEFTDLVDQVRRQEIVKHADETVVALRVQVEKIGKAVTSAQDLIDDPKLREDLKQSVANVRMATERANKVAANLETLTANANTTMGDVRLTVNKTNEDIDKLSRRMADDLDKLGLVFHQFEQVASKINNGKGTAGALINDPRLYDELSDTAKELNVVAKAMARLIEQWEKDGLSIKTGK